VKKNCAQFAALAISVGTALPVLAEDISDQERAGGSSAEAIQLADNSSHTASTTASAAGPAKTVDKSIPLGPLKLSLGGFFEFTGLYRQRNQTSDLATNLAGIPFPFQDNYNINEFRQTERDSRFIALIQGADGDTKLDAYLETDFLSAGISSNSGESNSYNPRVRQAFVTIARPGYSITAGQTWSLASLNTKGLQPRDIKIPPVSEGQYFAGFIWTRGPNLRFVLNPSKSVALGLALEAPQTLVRGTAPIGVIATNPGGVVLNPTANYSTDVAPDVITKVAFDPGFGHYEVYSLTRFFKDRVPTVPGGNSALVDKKNRTTVGESIGFGLTLPVIPKVLEFNGNALIGHGNGRYGSAQLADATYDSNDGTLTPLFQRSFLTGLVWHTTPTVDLSFYYGQEKQDGAYSLIPANNSRCEVPVSALGTLPASAVCGGVASVTDITGAAFWKFYHGSLGTMIAGTQVEYLTDKTYRARNGETAKTHGTVAFLTLRYFPFQ
jgi:hypothetical protein